MSVPDDAIERTQIAALEAGRYRDAKAHHPTRAEQITAESLALARRFAESLRAAGYRPLRARRLRLTHTLREVRLGPWPSRRRRTECSPSKAMLDIGHAWPVLSRQWTTLVEDRGEGWPPSQPGQDVYAGTVYLPGTDRLADAVFDGLTVQRTGNEIYGARDKPSFADLLAQREVTLRFSDVAGPSGDCHTCQTSLPAWHMRSDGASLALGTGPSVVDLPGGGTRDVYHPTGPQTDEELFAPVIGQLTANLVSICAPWAPPTE
jgi:hypothetical protein